MKAIFALAFVAAGVGAAAPALAQVNVTIGINQPGVYGRIQIGDLPPPALVYAQPVLIAPPLRFIERQPIYLYVPLVHQQQWGRYCGRYGACGQPVYFVRDEWVRDRYEHEHPGWNRGRHRGWDRQDERGYDGGDQDRDRGHGRGHDKDKGQDKDKHKDKGR